MKEEISMRSDQHKSGKFFLKQAILLAITVILLIFCTIPLLKAVKAALNLGELQQKLNLSKQEVVVLQKKLGIVEDKMMMGSGNEETQEKLKKDRDELKQQIAMRDLEIKFWQNQAISGQTIRNPKLASASEVLDLVTKIFGCIGSIFSGGMVLLSWWRKRRDATQPATSRV
jgi:hypothetical protein